VRAGWQKATLALLSLCGLGIAGALQLIGLSLANADGPRTYSRDIFNALPQHAILLTVGDAADLAPVYFQTVEHWRPDIVVIPLENLGIPGITRALADRVNVPPEVTLPLPPDTQRDLLIDANRARPFYTTGGYAIERSSSKYQPYVLGLVKRMISPEMRVNVPSHYDQERILMLAPGYGDITSGFWASNGWGALVRAYYAGGFFSAAVNAARTGKIADARNWYNAARSYDPEIQSQSP
jgi:hypothetical protein